MEEKRTDIPNLSGAPYQIKHQGVMDNGTVEIHYVDANGNMMRVYGRHEETCRRQSFFERLFRRKKKPKAPKVRKEKKPKTVSKDIWDLPQPPDPFRVSKRENEFRRCRLIHQVWVVGLNTDTRRYEMDFSIFPKSVWQDPDWISMSLALEGGAWADRIFAQSFPGRGGS
ncbi:MAG: hypothetical protein IJA71_10060, partial [Clostridia bacterium]|nr:hypothetical protein [Clostridia bacterium]